MTAIIQFRNVSKKFKLSSSRPRSFMDIVVRRRLRAAAEEFWALRDVSFEIEMGETVGLIGANGAGKSTVLKLISQIIEPSGGQVIVRGRIAGLLELGAGFHPDLSGRENIFLNASVLGVSRRDVKRQLDAIIDFAGVGSFIDAPVRHYSSGMAMRLGFAITTTLEPEILLVDEVLAVGDHAFQQKCLKRLRELKTRGVTVLMVSHDLASIHDLCMRSIWMQSGQIEDDGRSADVIDRYLSYSNERLYRQHPGEKAVRQSKTDANQRWGTYQAEITSVRFLNADGKPRVEFETGQPFTAEIQYHACEPIGQPVFGVAIHREDSVHVSGSNTAVDRLTIDTIDGDGVVYYHLDQLPLLTGHYQFTAAIYDRTSTRAYDHHHRMYPFDVQQGSDMLRLEGVVRLPSRWRHRAGTNGNVSEG